MVDIFKEVIFENPKNFQLFFLQNVFKNYILNIDEIRMTKENTFYIMLQLFNNHSYLIYNGYI